MIYYLHRRISASNMKIFAVIFLALALANAAPSIESEARKLPALQHEEVHDQLGQYSLRYVTAEGTIVEEKGHLVNSPDGSGPAMVVEGQVTYIGDDGNVYNTRYTAGFDGYKAEGDHLPVAPAAEPLQPVAEPVAPAVVSNIERIDLPSTQPVAPVVLPSAERVASIVVPSDQHAAHIVQVVPVLEFAKPVA